MDNEITSGILEEAGLVPMPKLQNKEVLPPLSEEPATVEACLIEPVMTKEVSVADPENGQSQRNNHRDKSGVTCFGGIKINSKT